MGSKSDLAHGQKIADALSSMGIDSEIRVCSAHKAAHFCLELLSAYESDGRPKVYVTIAGRSNALSGLVDAHVSAPSIACPPPSDKFSGADIFSSLRMPSGVAPAVVLDTGNAALLAAKILGLSNSECAEAVRRIQTAARNAVLSADQELNG
jgi:phosphoribosylaminoimidazole carboxylase PurE protein